MNNNKQVKKIWNQKQDPKTLKNKINSLDFKNKRLYRQLNKLKKNSDKELRLEKLLKE